MNLRSTLSDFESEVKALEGKYSDAVKNGSEDPVNYHFMSYYSGILNATMFWHKVIYENVDIEFLKKGLFNPELREKVN